MEGVGKGPTNRKIGQNARHLTEEETHRAKSTWRCPHFSTQKNANQDHEEVLVWFLRSRHCGASLPVELSSAASQEPMEHRPCPAPRYPPTQSRSGTQSFPLLSPSVGDEGEKIPPSPHCQHLPLAFLSGLRLATGATRTSFQSKSRQKILPRHLISPWGPQGRLFMIK